MRHYYNFGGGFNFYSMRNTTDTKLLIHSDTTDASTTFTDSSTTGHAITPAGDAQHSTTVAKFGATSMKFDGNGDYLTIGDHADFDLGSNPFTFDFWVYFTALPTSGNRQIIFSKDTGNAYFDMYNNSGVYEWRFLADTGGDNVQFSWSPIVSTWYHIALIRGWNGGDNTYMVTVNGISSTIIDDTSTTSFTSGSGDFLIGQASSSNYFNGYIDEFRMVKGAAMWTQPFLPPAGPYV